MSSKYKFTDPEGLYFVSFSVIHWIDVFTRAEYKDVLIEAFDFCRLKKGLRLHAYVIMTNHVHLIISTNDSATDLSGILRDLKKFTALKLIHLIKDNPQESRKEWMIKAFRNAGAANSNNKVYQFWQQDNHPIQISGEMVLQKLNYLHANPVKAGIVTKAEDYVYSSAGDYAGRRGLVKLDFLI